MNRRDILKRGGVMVGALAVGGGVLKPGDHVPALWLPDDKLIVVEDAIEPFQAGRKIGTTPVPVEYLRGARLTLFGSSTPDGPTGDIFTEDLAIGGALALLERGALEVRWTYQIGRPDSALHFTQREVEEQRA
jgi:hypothetical protein